MKVASRIFSLSALSICLLLTLLLSEARCDDPEREPDGDCDPGQGDVCDLAELAVSKMTRLMQDYTLVMDWTLEEDAAKETATRRKFQHQLRVLESKSGGGKPDVSLLLLEKLLLGAVKGIIKSRGNVIKDQMARRGVTEVWPEDVEQAAVWIPSLLDLLLNSTLFQTQTPGATKAVEAALLESVRLNLRGVADMLLDHLTIWSGSEHVSTIATELLPVAVSVQSRSLSSKLLALSCRSLSVPEQLNRLRSPSPLFVSHFSAWHVAEMLCSHFSAANLSSFSFDSNGSFPDSCVPCLVHRWLITSLININLSIDGSATSNSPSVEERTVEYCSSLASLQAGPSLLPIQVQPSEGSQDSATPAGGWRTGSYTFGSDETCDLPRYDADRLTPELFSQLHELSLPSIIVNVEPLRGKLRELFTRDGAKDLFASTDMLAGHIPYGEVFGLYSGLATGQEVLEYLDTEWVKYPATARRWSKQAGRISVDEEPPLYIFDERVLEKKLCVDAAGRLLPLPGFLPSDWKKTVHQFIWGSPGSGAPVHFHCPAINIMAYGRKRWTLFPPGEAHYSIVHPLHGRTRRHGPRKLPEGLNCVQQPGELLFLPKHWAHSTVNIDQTIGIAVEFDLPFC